MKYSVYPLLVAVSLSGCANVGPDAVGACMNDDRIMDMYRSAKTPPDWHSRKSLVGGIDTETGQVRCYWGETDWLSDIIILRGPGPACFDDYTVSRTKDCTYLMQGDDVIFKPRSVAQQELKQAMDVVWFLTGALAVGAAQGYAISHTSAQRTTYNQAAPPKPLDCRPTGVKGIGGAPVYRCK